MSKWLDSNRTVCVTASADCSTCELLLWKSSPRGYSSVSIIRYVVMNNSVMEGGAKPRRILWTKQVSVNERQWRLKCPCFPTMSSVKNTKTHIYNLFLRILSLHIHSFCWCSHSIRKGKPEDLRRRVKQSYCLSFVATCLLTERLWT